MNKNRNMKYQKRVTVNTRDVPAHVRDRFKAYCARRGYTMQEAIQALMIKAEQTNMRLDIRK